MQDAHRVGKVDRARQANRLGKNRLGPALQEEGTCAGPGALSGQMHPEADLQS
jgi:hypothetical protein